MLAIALIIERTNVQRRHCPIFLLVFDLADESSKENHMSKTVLITGAGSGFGKGAAVALAARGHQVIATTETVEQAKELFSQHPELRVEKIDITNMADVQKIRDWPVDVLINNAGYGQTGPMSDVPIDRLRRVFEVNVFGTVAITQATLPQMAARGSGRIIIVSSIAGKFAAPGFGPYAMSKHALEAMGKAMRPELAPQGIDVCLLNPGPYNTGFNDRMADSMWEWFNDSSINAPAKEIHQAVGQMVTTNQMDPEEVVTRMVELVEAETTTENNFVPEAIVAMLNL